MKREMQLFQIMFFLFGAVFACFTNGFAQQYSKPTIKAIPISINTNKSPNMICENKKIVFDNAFLKDDKENNHLHTCANVKGFTRNNLTKEEDFSVDYSERNSSILAAIDPTIGVNFEANELQPNVDPSDNSIAVSDAGYIVAVDNRTIEYYKTDGTAVLVHETLEHFFNDISLLQANFYDPKVIYDPNKDRFIFIVMNGGDVDNNVLALAFSKTDNPSDGWYKDYRILANALEPTFWMDRPSIGISTDELFISGGMATNSFDHATLWQIGLQDGYNGTPLDYRVWTNYSANPIVISPASYGQDGSYGPGIYMVGTDENGSNQVFLFDVTGHRNAPATVINTYSIACTAYSPGASANQLGNAQLLDAGDCRTQSSFYLNGKVHFVFSGDAGGNWNGIKYKIIDVANLSVAGGEHQWQLSGNFDYCYPSIASFGIDNLDESAMICFLRSGPSINPQICVVNFDDGAWSPSGTKIVKQSLGPVSLQVPGTIERWGDYTGIQRMHGNPNRTCWLVGAFCFGPGTNHWLVNSGWNAWAAEIVEFPVGIDSPIEHANNLQVYPNPASHILYINQKENDLLKEISIIDLSGRIVCKHTENIAKNYSINVSDISTGIYILQTKTIKGIKHNEKLIISN